MFNMQNYIGKVDFVKFKKLKISKPYLSSLSMASSYDNLLWEK